MSSSKTLQVLGIIMFVNGLYRWDLLMITLALISVYFSTKHLRKEEGQYV